MKEEIKKIFEKYGIECDEGVWQLDYEHINLINEIWNLLKD